MTRLFETPVSIEICGTLLLSICMSILLLAEDVVVRMEAFQKPPSLFQYSQPIVVVPPFFTTWGILLLSTAIAKLLVLFVLALRISELPKLSVLVEYCTYRKGAVAKRFI